MKVVFKEVATEPQQRPKLPRSGACASTLPSWHAHDAILVGGYEESPDKQRQATADAWTFSAAEGAWHPLAIEGPKPQARLVAQAAVVGDWLWLVGGWDPATPGTGGAILSDVWRLDLHKGKWEQVEVAGEAVPQISRFQMVAVGHELFIHTHRSLEDVLVLDTRAQPPSLRKQSVKGVFPDDVSPASRGLHSMTLAAAPKGGSGQHLYIYGGAPQSGPMMDDLWSLELGALVWHQHNPGGTAPHSRCSHAAGAADQGRYLLVCDGSYYGEAGKLQPLDDVAVFDTRTEAWVQPAVEGPRPSPRNASVMVPLRGSDSSFLLHGGWKPFVETYNDTYIVQLEA